MKYTVWDKSRGSLGQEERRGKRQNGEKYRKWDKRRKDGRKGQEGTGWEEEALRHKTEEDGRRERGQDGTKGQDKKERMGQDVTGSFMSRQFKK